MRAARLIAAVAALALGVAAPAVAAGSSRQTLVFSVRFATQSRNVEQVGAGGTVLYGQLRFLGPRRSTTNPSPPSSNRTSTTRRAVDRSRPG